MGHACWTLLRYPHGQALSMGQPLKVVRDTAVRKSLVHATGARDHRIHIDAIAHQRPQVPEGGLHVVILVLQQKIESICQASRPLLPSAKSKLTNGLWARDHDTIRDALHVCARAGLPHHDKE